MMQVDIIGSIIITLALMLICSYFHLGLFSSILLMIFAFVIMNYWGKMRWYWNSFKDLFRKKVKNPERKSPYHDLDLEE